MTPEYEQYLLSDGWKQKREERLKIAGRKCEACGDSSSLHCHHLTYAHIFNEPMSDLMILCEAHHEFIERCAKQHQISKIGDVDRLRKRTMLLIKNAHSSLEHFSPQQVQAWVSDQQIYKDLIGAKRKNFKRGIKDHFKSHPDRLRIVTNACQMYDRHHKIEPGPNPELSVTVSVSLSKPTSENETRARLAGELDALVKKYKKLPKRLIAAEFFSKIESML